MTAISFPRTLILMRHAKSAYPSGVGDHQRPLNQRGRREAVLAGDVIRHITGATGGPGWPTGPGGIDQVLCSTAQRTRETLQRTRITAPTVFSDGIYDAGVSEVLDLIRSTSDQVCHLLVIGHAPGMPGVVARLMAAAEFADTRPPALELLQRRGFPTSAIAVLGVSQPWSALSSAALVDFQIPREG